jgi:hypothetical protein
MARARRSSLGSFLKRSERARELSDSLTLVRPTADEFAAPERRKNCEIYEPLRSC